MEQTRTVYTCDCCFQPIKHGLRLNCDSTRVLTDDRLYDVEGRPGPLLDICQDCLNFLQHHKRLPTKQDRTLGTFAQDADMMIVRHDIYPPGLSYGTCTDPHSSLVGKEQDAPPSSPRIGHGMGDSHAPFAPGLK